MDTVLGLSLTSTTVGWALVDGADIDGATLACEEFGIPHNGGFGTGDVSARVAAVVSRVRAMLQAQGLRLRGIGVTWSGDVAADAALVLESLTDAGFENVAPVRFSRAAELLTGGIGPIVGSEQAAVCVIEPNLATIVMPEGRGDDTPAVAECSIDGLGDVISWLTGLFATGGWRPGVLVVAGAGAGLDKLGRRLDAKLSVPVFVQAGAQLALARGAALVLGPYAEFAGAPLDETPGGLYLPVRTRPLSYAGALTMLVGGVLTFVVSVSAALSLHLGPGQSPEPAGRVANASVTPTVARAVAPATPPVKAPKPSTELSETPAAFGALLARAPAEAPPPPIAPQPSGPRSLLSRVLGHMPHLPGH